MRSPDALPTGTKVGPYEIVALIGAGGMGEVYRARDSRLGREVALKVLPESFSRDGASTPKLQKHTENISMPHKAPLFRFGVVCRPTRIIWPARTFQGRRSSIHRSTRVAETCVA